MARHRFKNNPSSRFQRQQAGLDDLDDGHESNSVGAA